MNGLVRSILLFVSTVIFTPFVVIGQGYLSSDGHGFSVAVYPDKSKIMLGETTHLNFEVANLSSNELFFGDGGDYRNNIGRPDSYKVKVVDENGRPVPQPEVKYWMGGLYGSQRIPLNGRYARKLFLPHWATFDSPGVYRIMVTRSLSIGARNGSVDILRTDLKPVTVVAETRIEITETDQDKLGKVIDELGERMLTGEREQARTILLLLDFIKDRRTIPFWIRAVREYMNTTELGFYRDFDQTPQILMRYETPEAFNAVKAAMASKNKDVRLDVAEAFLESKKPEALQRLLAMKDDTYDMVRLRVVEALSKVDTAESTSSLLAMLKDDEEWVRKTAARALRERHKLPKDFTEKID